MYQNEVIHFVGGINEYIGELDQTKHPLGEGWLRINNPCRFYFEQQKDRFKVQISRIWGVDKLYRKFIDIYCPADSLKEIKVLDKNGGFYKAYMKELGRPDLNLIKAPTDADVASIGKGRKLN